MDGRAEITQVQSTRRRRGLSLVEILVVMFIILLLISMLLPVAAKLYRIVNAWKRHHV